MLGNWIKQSVSSGGTGNLTVASVTGFDTFANQFGDGTTNPPFRFFDYSIQDGNDWEIGLGHMSATGTLVRDIIKAKLASGTLTRYPATGLTVSTSAVVFCDLHSDSAEMPAVLNATTYGVPFVRHGDQFSTTTMAANYWFAWMQYMPRSLLSSGIRTHCSTAGGGTKWQMGLAQPAADGKIGKLLARTGDVTPATGDTTQSWNGGNKYIEKGWYWLEWSGDGAPVFLSQLGYGSHFGGIVFSNGKQVTAYNGGGLVNPLVDGEPTGITYTDSSGITSRVPLCELVSA